MTLVSLPHLNNLTNSFISFPIAKTIQEFQKFEYQTKDYLFESGIHTTVLGTELKSSYDDG